MPFLSPFFKFPVENGVSWQIQDFRPLQNFRIHSTPTALSVRSYAITHTVVSRAKGRELGGAIVRRLVGGQDQVRRSGSAIGFGGQLGGKSAAFRNFDFTQQ